MFPLQRSRKYLFIHLIRGAARAVDCVRHEYARLSAHMCTFMISLLLASQRV